MLKPSKASTKKAELIVAIQTLLKEKTVGTQDEICLALQKQGFVINQAKVSRTLHKIGAIKITEGDQVVYRLPVELTKLSSKNTLRQVITNITHNEVLVVIQSAPGSASLVARLLDLERHPNVLGTVAGDDTIFVTPVSIKKTKQLHQDICKMLLE